MNRNAKGAIAVGAATLLLLGGGGTFALWNTSQKVDASIVSSGELSLADGKPGAWYNYDDYVAHGAAATEIDLAKYHVVPKADLVFVVVDMQITAEGSNLHYTFDSNVDAAAAGGLGYTATVETLNISAPATGLPGTATAAIANEYADGSGTKLDAGTTVYSYDTANAETVKFTGALRVIFDADATDNFNQDLDLQKLQFVLQQVIKL